MKFAISDLAVGSCSPCGKHQQDNDSWRNHGKASNLEDVELNKTFDTTGLTDAQVRDQARLDFRFNASLTTLKWEGT